MKTIILLLLSFAQFIFTQTPLSANDFCASQGVTTIANGIQLNNTVSCSQTIQGILPLASNMVSTLILEPQNGATIGKLTNFTVKINSLNMDFGFFNDPAVAYYLQPQSLDANGLIQGHSHITIQPLAADGQTPPSAQNFVFFRGLNENALVPGELSVDVPGIADPGAYRICTMTASAGHQPVLMPIARRGAQDDCIRITIGDTVTGPVVSQNPVAIGKVQADDVTAADVQKADPKKRNLVNRLNSRKRRG